MNWRLITVLFVALQLFGASAVAKAERELVILILVDALRPDHMGAYGYTKQITPNMDRIAAEGTLFETSYVNAPWTRPSTASFLTGLNASRHGAQSAKTKLPREVETLAERLKKVGWKSSAFVANGNGGSLARLDQGFDVFQDPTNTYTRKKRGKTYNGLPTGEFLVGKALAHLRRSKAKKEFVFLFLVDPHDPYAAPKRLEKKHLGDHKGKVRRRALWEYDNDYPKHERDSMLAVYDAAIEYSDEALGHFFEQLKGMGRYDDATIIISSDHGEGFGEHGFYLHAHHFWEEVIRVPLIVKGKGFAKAARDSRLTQSIDVTRTIAELAGASTSGMPGYSLLQTSLTFPYVTSPDFVGPPLADFEAPFEPPYVISEYNEFGIHRQAIMDGRYKVIWQRPADEDWFNKAVGNRKWFPSVSFGKEVVDVFDLKEDPKEINNLRGSPPKRAMELLQILRDFVENSRSQGA